VNITLNDESNYDKGHFTYQTLEYTRNSFDYLIAIDNRLGKQDINVTFDSKICYGVGDSYVNAG